MKVGAPSAGARRAVAERHQHAALETEDFFAVLVHAGIAVAPYRARGAGALVDDFEETGDVIDQHSELKRVLAS